MSEAEAYIICLDNSEWMRNGDYSPSRFFSQNDAATLISSMKLDSNAETGVGIISMAGKTPTVLVSLTTDHGEILKALATIQIQGQVNLVQTLQTAQLSLRHRKNKRQRARISLFIGSPIKADKKDIKLIAKSLRRDGIALDIFSFGEVDENTEILTELHKGVDVKGNSKYIPILPNTIVLADAAMNSIFGGALGGGGEGGDAGNGGGHGGNAFEEYGGIDPNVDPELAMVMQMSIQESLRMRNQEESQSQASEPVNNNNNNNNNNEENKESDNSKMDVDPIDEQLKSAQSEINNNNNNNNNESANNDSMDVADDDEEAIRLAMELSMQTGSVSADPTPERISYQKAMSDPNFLGSLMESFPGLDPNDPLIKDALEQLKGKDSEDKDKKQ